MIQPPLAFRTFDAVAVGDRIRFSIRNTGFGQGFTIDYPEATIVKITANAVFLAGDHPRGLEYGRRYRVTRREWNERVTRFVRPGVDNPHSLP